MAGIVLPCSLTGGGLYDTSAGTGTVYCLDQGLSCSIGMWRSGSYLLQELMLNFYHTILVSCCDDSTWEVTLQCEGSCCLSTLSRMRWCLMSYHAPLS